MDIINKNPYIYHTNRKCNFSTISNAFFIQMASLQFNLEDCSRRDGKYKRQLQTVQAKVNNADQRFARDEEALLKLKGRMEMIGVRRTAKEEEKKKKKK